MRKILTLLVLSVILTSCLDAEKKKHVERIDQLSYQLDSLEKAYHALPLDSFSYMRETALNNENLIKNYFAEDTIDAEFARAMNRYKAIRKGSKFVMQKRNFLDTVFAFQANQLQLLKTDIENGVGKRDKYATYIDAEIENQTLIIGSYTDFSNRFHFLRNEFYELNPIVEKRIELNKSETPLW